MAWILYDSLFRLSNTDFKKNGLNTLDLTVTLLKVLAKKA